MAACDLTRPLTQAQLEAGFNQQRTGVGQALRPFSGSPTIENLLDYINRELVPVLRATRNAANDVWKQVVDNAPSANPLAFYFSTTTAAADPTAGRVRLNQAVQNTATVIRVSESNGRLQSVQPWLDVMSGGPTTPLGTVTLLDSINPGRFLRFDLNTMTDQGAYWDLGVSFIEGSDASPFVDDEAVTIGFIAGVSAAGSTVPVGSLSPIANDTFLGNVSGGVAAPSAVNLSTLAGAGLAFGTHTINAIAGAGGSLVVNANDIQRAALTGEVTAALDANATTVTRSTNFQTTPWTGNHQFNGEVRLGTLTTTSATGSVNPTLDPGSTRLLFSGTGAITVGTVATCSDGRVLVIEFTGSGTHTLTHGAASDTFSCPNDVDLVLSGRCAVIVVGRGTSTFNWKVVAVATDQRGKLIARTTYTSSSGTHTYDTACRRAKVRMKGAGGGGGGAGAADGNVAGGGGEGGYEELDITTVPTSSAYAVGAAGSAGSSSSGTGGTGGNTTFNDGSLTRTASGGTGGIAGGVIGEGGDGGAVDSIGGTVSYSRKGAPGMFGWLNSATGEGHGGNGGGSGAGKGGFGSSGGTTSEAGVAGATNSGAGGGGGSRPASPNVAGGAGAAGYIVVEEYS